MRSLLSQNFRLLSFYLLLTAFACLPIWSVELFINQDGSPHLYNAYIIFELLKNNPNITQIYALNPVPIPNLTGYLLLTGLLIFFSAATVTKLIVTFTFAAFVAAVGWLRFQTAGREDLTTSLLLGAALAFNWMWFLGFYNFIIGEVGFIFTLGLYYQWRENLNFRRSFVLSFLLIFVFFSHLISFLMLAASLLVLTIFVSRSILKRTLIWVSAAFLPVLPFAIGYKFLSDTAGGGAFPVWRHLSNPFSLSSWIMHLQAADPFQLLSRKAMPFLETDSIAFAVFSPVLWLAAALFCLSSGTFIRQISSIFSGQYLPFILLTTFSIIFWTFAPDDFGKSHGGFLRERVLLCGFICFVPLFKTELSSRLKKTAQVFLVFIIIFQTTALWDYALWSNELGQEYLSAEQAIKNTDSLGSIVLIENGCRFKSNPLTNINTLLGVDKNTRVWDNYEIGYYLFPVVARNPADRQFVSDFRESNTINLCNPPEIDEKISRLDSLLNSHHDKIKVMLVWNGDERVRAILTKWYDDKPYFQNGRVALFHHR
ncbi:MAG TPA: hypothetical protein VNI60_08615 [Pyrinomonadaceae bacterium]|nr:hypothetical protein [Pyrinomonadaceae bacterium]